MSCYYPLTAYNIAKSGDPIEFVFSRSKALQYGMLDEYKLPCRKCIGCRLDYSRQWADRCMLELDYHDSSYFATITYDDVHLPKSYSSDPATGEVIAPVATLRPRDMQLFLKRLRKRTGQHIRYMMCGEYGSHTLRPHYHAILFGLHLDDLVPYSVSPLGYKYYNSDTLTSCWTDEHGLPKGYIVLGDVTWDTCAYVARYVVKKYIGKDADEVYGAAGLYPEYIRMSRRPGLGRQYYDDHPDLWRYQTINVTTPQGGRQIRPPAYYRALLAVDRPNVAKELAKQRKLCAHRDQHNKMLLTDKEYADILIDEERVKLKSIKALMRNII